MTDPIGPRLRILREEHRLSLAEMAHRAGISVAALGSWERMERRCSVEQADGMLRVLDAELAIVPTGFDLEAMLGELGELRAFRAQVIADHRAAQSARHLEVVKGAS